MNNYERQQAPTKSLGFCTKKFLTKIFGVHTWDKQDNVVTFSSSPRWGVKPCCRQWAGGADSTTIISFSHDSRITAWLDITSYEKFGGNHLVEMIDRVWLAWLALSDPPTQPGLDITTSIFPHAAIVGSFGEEKFIIGDSRGTTRIGARPVCQVWRSRGLETWRGLQTLLKYILDYKVQVFRRIWQNRWRILLFKFGAAKMRREVCLSKLWNELWSTRNRKLFNLDFRR